MKKNRSLMLTIPLILLLAGLVVYKYGYQKVRDNLSSIKENQAVKMKLLEQYSALLSKKTDLEEKLALLKKERQADASKLIEGQTASLAAATLQDIVKGIITDRGGTISSERVGNPEDRGKFKVINVSFDAVVPDTGALSDILYSLETRTPYLVVKELDVRNRNIRRGRNVKLTNELIIKLSVAALTTG